MSYPRGAANCEYPYLHQDMSTAGKRYAHRSYRGGRTYLCTVLVVLHRVQTPRWCQYSTSWSRPWCICAKGRVYSHVYTCASMLSVPAVSTKTSRVLLYSMLLLLLRVERLRAPQCCMRRKDSRPRYSQSTTSRYSDTADT